MKRILAFLLVSALVFTLAACGKSGTDNSGDDAPLTRSDSPNQSQTPGGDESEEGGASGIITGPAVSLESVLTYIETGDTSAFDPTKLSEADKQALKQSVENAGGKIVYGADGSIDITGSDSTRIIIHPDGTYEGTDSDGNPFSYQDMHSWPDTELGRAVPEPDCGISLVNEEDGVLEALVSADTPDQVKAYAAKLKAAGFTEDIEETDMLDYGMYSFSAVNADRIKVDVTYVDMAGTKGCTVSAYAPGAWEYDDDDSYDDDYSYDDYSDDDYSYPDPDELYSSEWPDSGAFEYAPEPAFGSGYTVSDMGDSYAILVNGGTRADIETYIQALKAKGFTVDSEYEEDDDNVVYVGYNSAGYGMLAEFTYEMAMIVGTKAPVDPDDR
jgi:predicted small lipoprotein YifL